MDPSRYFERDGPAWRVHADPSGLVGGIRSLVVQALHPRAMAAVADHSDFRVDFWGRLRRTSDFLTTVVFGSREEADRAGAVVRSIHARISGTDSFTGDPYRADEPHLLRWIHLATLSSYLDGFTRYGPGLSAPDADAYVSEMRQLGVSVGLERESLPTTVAGLDEAMAQFTPELAASPAAREAVRRLVQAPLPLHLRPLWDVPAAAAISSMPVEYRRLYDLEWLGFVEPGIRVPARLLVSGLRTFLPPFAPAA